MMTKKLSYLLKTGQAGKERLELLDKLLGEETENLFNKIGIKKDMSVASVGCGTGSGVQSIYSRIGPNGKILCLDISNEQIEEAKKRLKCIESISYKVEDIQRADFETLNLDECGKYDVAYCRYLLIHLQNPVQALKNMLSMLKPNGIIACEEIFDNKLEFQFEDESMKLRKSLMNKLAEKNNCDFSLGLKLYSIFKQLGLTDIQNSGYQKFSSNEDIKKLILWTFLESQDKIIEHGIANEKEIEDLSAKLDKMIADISILGFLPMTLQIWARKP